MLFAKPSGHVDLNEAEWDATLHYLNGDLLQSWRWGEFKRRQGWTVARLRCDGTDGPAMALVLLRRRGPVSVAYLPRGPVIAERDTDASELLARIDETSARFRALVMFVEPDRPLPPGWLNDEGKFARGPEAFQTSRTVKAPLGDDAVLLAQMRRDTRYNVRHAQRRGVRVEHATGTTSEIKAFYRLLQETSWRNGFGIHAYDYYEDFLRVFEDQANLLFSCVDGVPTAALISARCGPEARSMYAGSATAHRARGDAALLYFEAMRWARAHGCTHYDLGGIAAESPPTESGHDGGSGDRRDANLEGVHQFKVGFGGEIITYPATVERRYRPAIAWLARRLYPRLRTAR